MKITRVDEAINACRKHLDSSGARGTEIEAFLTRYLLVMIAASFAQEVEGIFLRRIGKASDPQLQAFVGACFKTTFRSIKTSDIAGLLGQFDPAYKDAFRQKVDPKAETYFNNILINRHLTAHELGSNITFQELEDFYEGGHGVLDTVAEVLG